MEPRDASRLLVLHRTSGEIEHRHFRDIGDYLRAGDVLVLNQTRVIPARLYARKTPGGGKVELLLLRKRADNEWEALVGGKGARMGKRLTLENGMGIEIVEELEGAQRLLRFEKSLEPFLPQIGHTPLPPYIHAELSDSERYQTVYSRESGSAAAPTAGLHFTAELLNSLQNKGIDLAYLTLHVGLDTFAPVTEDDPAEHLIHTEWCQLSKEAAGQINRARAARGRIVAVGTTSVRVLESAAAQSGGDKAVNQLEGPTGLFILPGHAFKDVDALITNFHLPRSTLLMLVSAFAGRELILSAYQKAIEEGYRFYSFGDAMLIL